VAVSFGNSCCEGGRVVHQILPSQKPHFAENKRKGVDGVKMKTARL
jgi:hypothetical protein